MRADRFGAHGAPNHRPKVGELIPLCHADEMTGTPLPLASFGTELSCLDSWNKGAAVKANRVVNELTGDDEAGEDWPVGDDRPHQVPGGQTALLRWTAKYGQIASGSLPAVAGFPHRE